MNQLEAILSQVETGPQKLCRKQQITLFAQYNLHQSNDQYLSFQSGRLHVFAGDRFTGKSSLARYLIEHSFCEDYAVNPVIESNFPKYTQLKRSISKVQNLQVVDFIYEDIGRLVPLNLKSIHIMHYNVKPCKIFSQPIDGNPECFLYYFSKLDNFEESSTSVSSIHVIHYTDRISMINDLNNRFLNGFVVGKLKMKISKSVILEPF